MTISPTTPIGKVLIAAGLISEGQRQTILYDQQCYKDMQFGEILVLRGWLSQQTINFFCAALQRKGTSPITGRLGEHLAAAGLLSPQQVQQILEEQKLNHLRFGALAVLKGYVSQQTLDFFLQYFCKTAPEEGHYRQAKQARPRRNTFSPRRVAQRQTSTLPA